MGILIATCSHITKDHINKVYKIKGQLLKSYKMTIYYIVQTNKF